MSKTSRGPASQADPAGAKAAPAKPDTAKTVTARTGTARTAPAKAAPARAGRPTAPIVAVPPPPRPPTIKIAVALMGAGAVLSVLGAFLSTLGISRMSLAQLRKSLPKDTVAQLHAAQHSAILSAWVTSGLILTALWLVVAVFTYRGLPWIRIVATALFAMNTWNGVALLVSGPSAGNLTYSGLVWLIGLGATVLLWLPASNAYLRARPKTA